MSSALGGCAGDIDTPSGGPASREIEVIARDAGLIWTTRGDAAAYAAETDEPWTSSSSADAAATSMLAPADASAANTPVTQAEPAGQGSEIPRNYYVDRGRLYDGCGEQVILRGVNHLYIYIDRAGDAIPEIARTGANVVRLGWYAGNDVPPSEMERAVERTIDHSMIALLEFHDTTGKWELDRVVDYWLDPEVLAMIQRHQRHLLINIANEATYPDRAAMVSGYTRSIQRMRAAGIHTPLVIDAGRWGREYRDLLSEGPALLAADPDHNLIFSAHLYDALSRDEYIDFFGRARQSGLVFIVGEFANREPPGCGRDIDYRALIEEADAHEIGYLPWSWGDNDPSGRFNTDCALFDMTETFSYDSLRDWGLEVAVTHPASIQNTSRRPYSLVHDRCAP